MQGMFDDVTVTAIRTFYDESQLTANDTISQRGLTVLPLLFRSVPLILAPSPSQCKVSWNFNFLH